MSETFTQYFGRLPRRWKLAVIMGFDGIALTAALWASYALRYGRWTPPQTPEQFALLLVAPALAIVLFYVFGVYRSVVRYLTDRTLWTILQAITIATLVWVVIVFLTEMSGQGGVPRSVPILYWALGSIIVVGGRLAAKRLLWSSSSPKTTDLPLLIYGAGEAGAELALAIKRQPGMNIVGFLDKSSALQGRDVSGVRVYSPTHLNALIDQHGVREIILSMPSLDAQARKDIVRDISRKDLKIRTLPHIVDLVSGKYLYSQVHEIDIDELLGRSSVPADPVLVREMIEARTIMVTGAGGSIGSELCRLIAKWSPQRLILLEANEHALYQIERELSANKDLAIVAVLGSITDEDRVRQAIVRNRVTVVFHAAAHKHVPLVEANALEGIRNNVMGTLCLANIAFDEGVESFVLISSDKAVRPTNVMGATKRWAELIVRQKSIEAQSNGMGQRFSSVRFGNVLGSNGSVVPLFKEQIAKGGPLTLTDARMTRYFMSIHEAAELIVQAGALSKGGDIFLLEMGAPVHIRDLAENMVRLAGLRVRDASTPDGDIEIVETGARPGEKLYEELFYDEVDAQSTQHPKIMRARIGHSNEDLGAALARLSEAMKLQDDASARAILFDFIR